MVLPALPGHSLSRLTLYAPDKKAIWADSNGNSSAEHLEVLLKSAAKAESSLDFIENPLDLKNGCRLRLRFSDPAGLPRDQTLIVQLHGVDGTVFGAVPVLEP
jgi:hypothetical protein